MRFDGHLRVAVSVCPQGSLRRGLVERFGEEMAIKANERAVRGELFAPAWHRPWLRYITHVDGEGGVVPAAPAPVAPVEPAKGVQGGDEPLGEPGLKALRAERERAAAAEKLAAEREAKLREYEDRDKSAEQKAQEERERLAREIAELQAAKARAEVAAASSVPVAVLAGPKSSSAEDVQAYADALIAWRGEQAVVPAPVSKSYVIPDEGGKPAIGKEDSIRPGVGTLRAAYGQVSN